jgi:hypothetical protein
MTMRRKRSIPVARKGKKVYRTSLVVEVDARGQYWLTPVGYLKSSKSTEYESVTNSLNERGAIAFRQCRRCVIRRVSGNFRQSDNIIPRGRCGATAWL